MVFDWFKRRKHPPPEPPLRRGPSISHGKAPVIPSAEENLAFQRDAPNARSGSSHSLPSVTPAAKAPSITPPHVSPLDHSSPLHPAIGHHDARPRAPGGSESAVASMPPAIDDPRSPPEPSSPGPSSNKESSISEDMFISGLQNSLQLLGAMPFVGHIAAPLNQILDIVKRSRANTAQLRDLFETILSLQEALPTNNAYSSDLDEPVKALSSKLIDLSDSLHDRVNGRGSVLRALDYDGLGKLLADTKEAINHALQIFHVKVHVNQARALSQLSKQDALTFIAGKAAVADYTQVSKECAPKTRLQLLATLKAYLMKHLERFIWLRGSVGVGKSAIAKTIAAELDNPPYESLCASFFFDKHGTNSGKGNVVDIKLFPPTVAMQLAKFDPLYAQQLASAISLDPSIFSKSLEDQMKNLIVEPLRAESMIALSPHPVYMVIDGLDECVTPPTSTNSDALSTPVNPLQRLMTLISTLDACPNQLHVLMCCRPEDVVLNCMKSNSKFQSILVEDMDKMDDKDKEGDILENIGQQLTEISRQEVSQKELSKDDEWHPTLEDAQRLSDTCGGLMLLASIRLRKIEDMGRHCMLQEAFQTMLDRAQKVGGDLDGEYRDIVRRVRDDFNETMREVLVMRYRKVMSLHLATDRNGGIGIDCLALVAGMRAAEASMVLRPLSSVLKVDAERGIQFYHASFKEFTLKAPSSATGPEEDLRLGGHNWRFDAADMMLSYLDKLQRNVLNLDRFIEMFEFNKTPAAADEKLLAVPAKSLSWSMSCMGIVLGSLDSNESAALNVWSRLEKFMNNKVLFGLELVIPYLGHVQEGKPGVPDLSLIKKNVDSSIEVLSNLTDNSATSQTRHLLHLRACLGILQVARKPPHDSQPVWGRVNADGRLLFRDFALFRDDALYKFHPHSDITVTLVGTEGQLQPRFDPLLTGLPILSSSISADGCTVALLPSDGSLRMVSFLDGAWSRSATNHADKGAAFVWTVFLRDNRLIAGDDHGMVYMFGGQDWRPICTHGPIHGIVPLAQRKTSKSSVTLSHDGSSIARIMLLLRPSAFAPDVNGYSIHLSVIQIHPNSLSHWTSSSNGPGRDQQARPVARQNSLPLAPNAETHAGGSTSPVWGLSSEFFGFSPNDRFLGAFVFFPFGKKGDEFRIYSWDTRVQGPPSEIKVSGLPFDEFVLTKTSPGLSTGVLEDCIAKDLQYPTYSNPSFCVLGGIPRELVDYFPQTPPSGSSQPPQPPQLGDMIFTYLGPRERVREAYGVSQERNMNTYYGVTLTEKNERLGIDGAHVCCLSKGSFLFHLPTEYSIKHALNSLPLRIGGSRLLLGGHVVDDSDTSDSDSQVSEIKSLPLHVIDLSRIL